MCDARWERLKDIENQFEEDGERDENDERDEDDVRPAEHVAAAGAASETETLQRSFTVRALRHDSQKSIGAYRSTQTRGLIENGSYNIKRGGRVWKT